jgi:GR25 family glycosyltransferase involved in LPS biosynthesis
VYVVNLARRPERLASVINELNRNGVSSSGGFRVERFDAIEGSKLNADVLVQRGFLSRLGSMRLRESQENKIWGMDLNPGAVGCAMSHILLWAQIAAQSWNSDVLPTQESDEGVLIVEDDSLFPHDGTFLTQLRDRMQHVPPHWQFVYVGGLDTGRAAPRLQVGPGVSRVPQLHRTTNCYLVRPEGARQLLERCLPFTYQIDTQMTAEVKSCPTSGEPYSVAVDEYYTLQPPLVTQAGSEQFASDIQQ